MAKHAETFTCKVKLWGQDVGYLVDHRGAVSFSFDKKFLSTGYELSPIMMPLREGVFTHANSSDTFQNLMGVFSDSLPDFYGRQVVKAYFKSKYGDDTRFVSPIQQLTYIGSRGLGALEYEPQDQPTAQFKDALEIAFLVEQAKKILEGDFEVNATAVITSIMQSNSVAGGARPKALIGWNQSENRIIAGVPPLPEGFEHWLVKFDATNGKTEPFGRAEYVYSKLARECGINMHDTRLIRERDNAHFLTRRFDRDGEETKHMHSLCGMTHVDYTKKQGLDYEEYFTVVQRVTADQREVVEAFRRMVFNFVGRNQDDHSKNFAFLMDKEGQWKLSPAYDLSYSFNPQSEWVSAHLMTINGESINPTKKDLLKLAKKFDIKHAKEIIEHVESVFSAWPKYAMEEGVDSQFISLVADNLRLDTKLQIALNAKKDVLNVDSYADICASPQTCAVFLSRALDVVVSAGSQVDLHKAMSGNIEVGGVSFNQRDYFDNLERNSTSWNWGDVPVSVKLNLTELVNSFAQRDPGFDVGSFISGFYSVQQSLNEGQHAPGHDGPDQAEDDDCVPT